MSKESKPAKQRTIVQPSGRVNYFTGFDTVVQLYFDTNSPVGNLTVPVQDHHLVEKIKETKEVLEATVQALEAIYKGKTQTSEEVGNLMAIIVTANVALMGTAVIFGAPYDTCFAFWLQKTIATIQGDTEKPIPSIPQVIEMAKKQYLEQQAQERQQQEAANQPAGSIIH